MARDYTALPHEYLEEMDELTDEEYGRLIRALQEYSISGIVPSLEGSEKYYLRRVVNREDRYKEQFDDIGKKLKERAEKGAAARWEKAKDAKECLSIPKHTQASQGILKDAYNAQTKTETETKIESIISPKGDSALVSEVVEQFHKLCPKLAKVRMITASRKTAINARLKENGLEQIIDVFKLAEQSDFLTGENGRGWKADFDWLLKPANFAKVLEGNYSRKKPNKHGFEQREIDFEADEALYMTQHLKGDR